MNSEILEEYLGAGKGLARSWMSIGRTAVVELELEAKQLYAKQLDAQLRRQEPKPTETQKHHIATTDPVVRDPGNTKVHAHPTESVVVQMERDRAVLEWSEQQGEKSREMIKDSARQAREDTAEWFRLGPAVIKAWLFKEEW